MVSPVVAMALIEGGTIGVVGVATLISKKIYENRMKEKMKHTRGRRPKKHKRKLMLGEPRDAVFISDKSLEAGDKLFNSIVHTPLYEGITKKVHNKRVKKLMKYVHRPDRFQKEAKWIESKIEKASGRNSIKHQSALRHWLRVQKKAGDTGILDRSLKDVNRILK